jgi:hypothetical protein
MVNPRDAANMPAFKAPIPKPVVACLERNLGGCPYVAFEHLFDKQTSGDRRLQPTSAFGRSNVSWSANLCILLRVEPGILDRSTSH